MKKFFFVLTIVVLLLPISVFGYSTTSDEGNIYTRTPDGTQLVDPISVSVVLTGTGESYAICEAGLGYWTFYFNNSADELYRADIVPISQLTLSKDFYFPVGYKPEIADVRCVDEDFGNFSAQFSFNTACSGYAEISTLCDDSPIFEIVAGGGGGAESVFTMPANFATGTLAYVSGLFTDLSTPIYIVIGFLLFFLIADWLTNHFKKRTKKINK